ncbi:MAG: WbqC family protein [Alphaproteobacteria bacterium]|nr:WbqC family protein [Alphaproteobacteria bacterium]
MTTIAVMQPTFLPWIGYFDLIDRVDRFVYLDTVEFSKQSWQQRNRIKTANGPMWLSLPVQASKTEHTTVADATVGPVDAVRKWRATLAQAYAKAAAVELELGWIDTWLADLEPGRSLAATNIDFIERACERLGIDTPRVRASALGDADDRIERLVALCRELDADTYLSPPGAANYLRDGVAAFRAAGVALMFQAYEHPTYPQGHGAFQSHASVIDLLLNTGSAAGSILRSGRRAAIPASAFLATLTDDDDGG